MSIAASPPRVRPANRVRTFSTGQVARICEVSPRTVGKWIDSGRLPGYRIPGGEDRRVTRDSLVRFLRDNGMAPIDGRAVLLVGLAASALDALRPLLPEPEGFRLAGASCGTEAGMLAVGLSPAVVVVDLSIGRLAAAEIVQALRRVSGTPPAFLAVTGDRPDSDAFEAGFSSACRGGAAEIAAAVRALVTA